MNYFTRHIQSGLYSLGKLSRAPLSSLMTCLIIGIALALPAVLFITLKNAELIDRSFKNTLEMTLYLKQDATPADVRSLLGRLKNQNAIKNVRAISPNDGLKELQQQAGFDASLGSLQDNPLPWTVVISPVDAVNNPARFEQLRLHLQQLPSVDTVQLDILWVKRLTSFITLAHRIMYALSIFLGMAVLLIVNNTIRSATEQHHKEIEIIKLIGGTYAFIRRPFLYVGMLYGLLGGLVSWLLVVLLMLALKSPSEHLAELYGSHFSLTGMSFGNLLILLGGSAGLGLIGSWLAVTRHLHQR